MYLTFSKTNGSTYVYIREYVGRQAFKTTTERTLAGLGRVEVAMMKIAFWKAHESLVPEELKNKGVTITELNEFEKKIQEKTKGMLLAI